uniref:Uncharacterized protein n=1 Tax=Avena sativa TaxID=4498 RepID=A0ACD5TA90_AVESA
MPYTLVEFLPLPVRCSPRREILLDSALFRSVPAIPPQISSYIACLDNGLQQLLLSPLDPFNIRVLLAANRKSEQSSNRFPTTMAFADWSSLPDEPINRIADCFLATSDLDYYMDFRAVCHSWRSATEDPKNSPDPRFRPRQWIIIDRSCDSNSHLFVNTTTGRFLRKELPLLRDYCISSVTPDGLLILFAIKSIRISVLNSFTGYFIHFNVPLPNETIESAALLSGSSPSIVLLCKKMYIDDDSDDDGNDALVIHESSRKVYTADLDSDAFTMYEDRHACPLIRLAVRGIYTKGELGLLAQFPVAVAKRIFDMMRFFNVEPAETSDDEDTIMSDEEAMLKLWIGYDNRCFLLESACEILIIIKLNESVEVYKMDTDSYLVERAENIGNRAIFLCGFCRCMSVNADKFPSVGSNCIYYIKSMDYSDDYICMYNIKFQREERVSEEIFHGSPHTIIQFFSSYNLQ